MGDDALKSIIMRIFAAVVVSMIIVIILKPFLSIAADIMVCGSCDPATAILLSGLILFGTIGIAMYKLMGTFYGTGAI